MTAETKAEAKFDKDSHLPEEKVALADGFFDGHRIKRGAKFPATKGDTGRWFKPANSKDADVAKVLSGEPDLLDQSVAQILPQLTGMSVRELHQLKNAEMAGKTRKSLIARIEDEIANRVGEIDPPAEEEIDPLG